MHDGTKNVYSFKKNGVTFKMQSLVEEGEMKSSSPSVLMVGEKESFKNLEEGHGFGFALVLKPKGEVVDKKTKVPHEVQKLLDQYHDIFSDGKLATLHPKRLVSHQVRLYSWSHPS